jgi:hypothetical protein
VQLSTAPFWVENNEVGAVPATARFSISLLPELRAIVLLALAPRDTVQFTILKLVSSLAALPYGPNTTIALVWTEGTEKVQLSQ